LIHFYKSIFTAAAAATPADVTLPLLRQDCQWLYPEQLENTTRRCIGVVICTSAVAVATDTK